MDYSKIIELDNITIGICDDWYKYSNKRVVINDGQIIDIKCEDV